MTRFIGRRLLQGIVLLCIVATIVFFLGRLTGNPVDLMLPVARQPGADAKLRQNLALSLALAGRWQDARLVAAMDLSPTETDKRIEEWAAFARPAGLADSFFGRPPPRTARIQKLLLNQSPTRAK